MKTVELITELVEKEDEFLKTAEVMKKHHKQAKEDQYIEAILTEYLGAGLNHTLLYRHSASLVLIESFKVLRLIESLSRYSR